jgi:hypothetical protein
LKARKRSNKKALLGFELWDNESGNLMGDYDTEEEALTALDAAIKEYGPSYADSIALLCIFPSGPARIADGADLVVRTRQAAAAATARAAINSQPLGSYPGLLKSPKRKA